MSYSSKSIILFVLALSFLSFFSLIIVTQSLAQISERISISVINSSFVPLTNTDANQVRVGIEYTIEDESIENEMINAVMKVYAPNGSLIRTTSNPSGFTAQGDGGVEILKTTFLDKSIQSILANITFTDLTKKVPVSNVITVNLDLEEPPASTTTGMLSVSCREVGVDCGFVGKGESEKELMDNLVDHAIKDHGFTREDVLKPEMQEKIKAHIHKS